MSPVNIGTFEDLLRVTEEPSGCGGYGHILGDLLRVTEDPSGCGGDGYVLGDLLRVTEDPSGCGGDGHILGDLLRVTEEPSGCGGDGYVLGDLLRITEEPSGCGGDGYVLGDLLRVAEDPLRPVAWGLRDIIFEADPEVYEVVRPVARVATFGAGARKMIDGYCYIQPHKSWVNLGFHQGHGLADPTGLLEGAGAKMRHAKIHLLDDGRQPAVRGLIECALAKRRETAGQSVTTSGNGPGPVGPGKPG